MLQIHRALLNDPVHHSHPVVLHGLESDGSAVPIHRFVHLDPALNIHGSDRVLQVADPALTSRVSAFHACPHISYRILHYLSSNLDLHVLLRLEAKLLQAVHPSRRGR
jgi:hypothetical protein